MKENKSTIIGFVLMTLVFVGYMFYANHQAAKQQEAQMAAQVEQLAEQASQALDTPAEQKAEAEITDTKSKQEANVPKFVSDAEKVEEVVVENDVMQVRFSTLGAQIMDVTLKEYTLVAPARRINATSNIPRLLTDVAIHAQVVRPDGVRDAPALQVLHRVANRPHGVRHVDTYLGERHRVGRCDLAAERDHRVLDLAFDRIAGERIALEVAVEQIGADEIGDLVRMAERDEFRGLLHFLFFLSFCLKNANFLHGPSHTW